MKKILIMAALCALACSPHPVYGQDSSYGYAINSIVEFEAAKHYTPTTTGPLLTLIFEDLVAYDGYYMSEGLKKRLVGGVSKSKFSQQLNGAANLDERYLLDLLYDTQQTLPLRLEDTTLHSEASRDGLSIKTTVKAVWSKSEIASEKLVWSLDDLDPDSAATMAYVIAEPWYSPSARVYEDSNPTWAAESLFEIRADISLIELAKRSAVVKLLNDYGAWAAAELSDLGY
jgi:hypothetical protein